MGRLRRRLASRRSALSTFRANPEMATRSDTSGFSRRASRPQPNEFFGATKRKNPARRSGSVRDFQSLKLFRL